MYIYIDTPVIAVLTFGIGPDPAICFGADKNPFDYFIHSIGGRFHTFTRAVQDLQVSTRDKE